MPNRNTSRLTAAQPARRGASFWNLIGEHLKLPVAIVIIDFTLGLIILVAGSIMGHVIRRLYEGTPSQLERLESADSLAIFIVFVISLTVFVLNFVAVSVLGLNTLLKNKGAAE